jgi:hypothetical protein
MTDNQYDKAEENEPVTMEEPGAITQPNARNPRRLHSAQSSGMESSVLRFNLNFTVGSKGKQKAILSDVAATVKWGRKFLVWRKMLGSRTRGNFRRSSLGPYFYGCEKFLRTPE